MRQLTESTAEKQTIRLYVVKDSCNVRGLIQEMVSLIRLAVSFD